MSSNWPGILIVDELIHKRGDLVLLEKRNLKNILHLQGEEQILKALFAGGNISNSFIPSFYYLGLDNRTTVAVGNQLTSITGEPLTSTGYARASISSVIGFSIEVGASSCKAKTTNLIGFSAISSSWGPIKNLFLTNVSAGTAGILYSSVTIGSDIVVAAGDTISLRFSMTLRNP